MGGQAPVLSAGGGWAFDSSAYSLFVEVPANSKRKVLGECGLWPKEGFPEEMTAEQGLSKGEE